MGRPTYSEVHETIARFAPDVAPLFADAWERFPVGRYAESIAEALRSALDFWGRRESGRDAAAAITAAINEIGRRAAE